MRLEEYLKRQGESITVFAKKLNRTDWTIRRYIKRGTRPSPEIMIEIYHATGGAVTPNDWFEIPKRTTA